MKKYIVYAIFFFMLTSCFGNKNDVTDENTAITGSGNVFIDDGNQATDGSLSDESEVELPEFDKDLREISFTELGNSLYQNGGDNLYAKIELLSASGETMENKQKATYLESFVGNYSDALANREALCLEEPESSYCEKVGLVLTSFLPEDSNGFILNGVTVYIDGRQYGELTGVNNLTVENKFVHRVRATKEGYLDFFKKISLDTNSRAQESFSPVLMPADKEEIVASTNSLQLQSDNFNYNIESNSFVDKDGNAHTGEVKLYFFDLGEEEGSSNVFNLDSFDNSGSYTGYSFVTYGMPLIIPYDTNGNRLFFAKGMTGKGKIQNVSSIPGIDLVGVPKNVYLGRAELEEYGIPPFWNIDLESGVWYEAEMKILDEEGSYEFKYY